MANFTQEQIEQALTAKSERLTPADVRRIAEAGAAVMKMVNEFPSAWLKSRKQATLLFDLIENSAKGQIEIHPDELKFAAGALIYLGDPLDLVPDGEEDGYADDAAIVALAIKRSEKQVRLFCQARGLDASDYLD